MEKLLTTKQVADRLNMHPKTLYRALRENTIALNFIQTSPRRFGFRPADVARYLDEREVIRTGDSPRKPRPGRKPKEYRYFTDAEAQEFFAGVERDAEGNIVCFEDEG
jgi:excisionase family DNA binding protein